MTKDPVFSDKPPTHSETMRELFSEKKESFIDALECLYIRKNQGGRLIFAEKWPAAAEQIFSDELVRYDHDGVENDEDRERRAALEYESEEQREKMLAIFDKIESRLVIYGSLRVEELDKIMAQLNRPVAEYVFTDRFVNKYFPNPDQPTVSEPGKETNNTAPVEGQKPESSAEAQSHQETAPVHKESVEVPDIEVNSIGHVDHSFSSTSPSYKQGEDGEDSEDMSWLDASEEDEFGDVKPISTEGATAPAVTEPMPQSDMSPPEEMSLKAHQSNPDNTAPPASPTSAPPPPFPEEDEDSDVGLFDSVRKESEEEAIDVPAAPYIEEPSRGQAPEAEEPRRPMGMDGVRQAQQEQRRPPEPPPSQQPAPSQAGSDNPPPRPPMGMGALRQDQNPAQNQTPAQRPEDQVTPHNEAAPPAQEEKKDEKPAPRVPSLDDIDKHMSGSGSGTGSAPSGFPPIPGSEDD